MTPRHLVLVGATASGKSDVAVALALSAGAQIISLDSMQIYKGMEIGTGTIPLIDRKNVIHHQLDFVDPVADHTVKQFQTEVYNLLEIFPEMRFVFVGGTGLYTHAVVDNFAFAPTDATSRASIIEKYELDEDNPDEDKVARAYEVLTALDPASAAKIDPLNVRRIVRSLEAIEISGVKFSEIGDGVQTFGKPFIDVSLVGLRYSREALRTRIVARVDAMFSAGWIDEVRELLPRWEQLCAPARNAIGYEPIAEWIRAGEDEKTLGELKEHIVNKTAQFSRRQRKWFERDPRITWIECDGVSTNEIIEQICTRTGW